MNSKNADRRGFLKRSAALAGLAVGSIPFANGKALASVTPGLIDSGEPTTKRGVTPDEPTIEDLAYGGRSSYENTVRAHSRGTTEPRGIAKSDSASGFDRSHHTSLSPLSWFSTVTLSPTLIPGSTVS